MRDALRGLARKGAVVPDHFGLAYDRWAPINTDHAKEKERWKLSNEDRETWLTSLSNIKVPNGYEAAFTRWKDGLAEDRSLCVEVTFCSRLLLGHGNPTAVENGLTVHHTWGTPVIPGSSLKGLLNHYVQVVYGPDGPGDKDREDWRGVGWDGGRIKKAPGKYHKYLFGAPASDDAPEGMSRGNVIFQDAWMVPGVAQPFARDVLTPHQFAYYRDEDGAAAGPNDWDSPNPVGLMTVKPGVTFLLALTGPEEWTRLTLKLLVEALYEWGVGGKTAAGYGRIDSDARDKALESLLTEEDRAQKRAEGWAKELFEAPAIKWVRENKADLEGGALSAEQRARREKLIALGFAAAWAEGKQKDGKNNEPAKVLTELAAALGVVQQRAAAQPQGEASAAVSAEHQAQIDAIEKVAQFTELVEGGALEAWPLEALKALSGGAQKKFDFKKGLKGTKHEGAFKKLRELMRAKEG
jgi:CRISPR-associated protein Cmr6